MDWPQPRRMPTTAMFIAMPIFGDESNVLLSLLIPFHFLYFYIFIEHILLALSAPPAYYLTT